MSLRIATSPYTDATIDAAIADAHARIEHIMQVRGKMNGNHTHDTNNIKAIANAIGFLMKRAKHAIQSPEEAAAWLANKRYDRAHDTALAADRQVEGIIAIDSLAQALGVYPVMEKAYNGLSMASHRAV